MRVGYRDEPARATAIRRLWRPRRYDLLAHVPVLIPRAARFLLDSYGHASSKSGIAADELLGAGAQVSMILPKRRGRALQRLCRALRRVVHLPRAFALDAYLRRRMPHLADRDAAVIIARDAFGRLFRRHPRLVGIVISDISPLRAVIASGAASAGARVMWWQDDYHHTSPPRLGFTDAAVLNAAGAEAFAAVSPTGTIYTRSSSIARTVVLPDGPLRVGAAVNGFFTGSPTELRVLHGAMRAFCADEIELRLHPRSRLDASQLGQRWVRVGSVSEPLEAFLERVDVVICGNTAAQLRIVASGKAVVHCAGLDPQGFDTYALGQRGIVYAVREPDEDESARVRAFYASHHDVGGLRRVLEPFGEGEQRGLDSLVESVTG